MAELPGNARIEPQTSVNDPDYRIDGNNGNYGNLEVKYSVHPPDDTQAGGARTLRQIQQGLRNVAGRNGQMVVWSRIPPTQAVLDAYAKALGSDFSKVLFLSGGPALYNWVSKYFGN